MNTLELALEGQWKKGELKRIWKRYLVEECMMLGDTTEVVTLFFFPLYLCVVRQH